MKISCIVAVDNNNAIGYQQNLLWHLPEDFKWFKSNTLHKTLMMGRKTFESLPNGPLKNRTHWVLTRHIEEKEKSDDVFYFKNLSELFHHAYNSKLLEIMIIGGGEIYAIMMPYINHLLVTHVHTKITAADTFFPCIDEQRWTKKNCRVFQADDRHLFSFDCIEYEGKSQRDWRNLLL